MVIEKIRVWGASRIRRKSNVMQMLRTNGRYRSGCCCGIHASLAPRAVIAIGEHGIDALDPETGETLTLEHLRRDLPGVDEVLASVHGAPA